MHGKTPITAPPLARSAKRVSPRHLRLLAIAAGVFGLIALWRSVVTEPRFYREALHQPRANQERASDELLTHAAALTSTARYPGPWQLQLTSEQVNGWLAIDFANNLRELLPPQFSQPRVALDNGEFLLACRYTSRAVSTVCTLRLRAEMPRPNVFEIELVSARAGWWPLPKTRLMSAINALAAALNWRVEWRERDGSPLAVVRPAARDERQISSIDAIEIDPEGIRLCGHNPEVVPAQSANEVAAEPGSARNENRQR